MPHSLVLNITPESPIYPNFLTGRHYHALFLNLVSSVDKKLGDYLHESNADKAFTLSPLQVKNRPKTQLHTLQYAHQNPIDGGTSCWWRISLLDDNLFSQLTPLWLNINPDKPWHLGSANLFVTSIQGTPQITQPWANACSYNQLYQQASEQERNLNFIFSTPVAFRQGTFDNVLPTRESVFNSLLHRWHKYSGIQLTNVSFESIYPSAFNMKTEVISNYDNKFIGCLGEISYRILGNLEAMQIKQINALADFALYASIGRKTTMGMGMARRK